MRFYPDYRPKTHFGPIPVAFTPKQTVNDSASNVRPQRRRCDMVDEATEELGIIRKVMFGWSTDHTALVLTVEVQILSGRFTDYLRENRYTDLMIAVEDVTKLPGASVLCERSSKGLMSVKKRLL